MCVCVYVCVCVCVCVCVRVRVCVYMHSCTPHLEYDPDLLKWPSSFCNRERCTAHKDLRRSHSELKV